MICNQTRVKPEPPPIQAIVPKKPLEVWQFDYIGLFPEDTVKKKKSFCYKVHPEYPNGMQPWDFRLDDRGLGLDLAL